MVTKNMAHSTKAHLTKEFLLMRQPVPLSVLPLDLAAVGVVVQGLMRQILFQTDCVDTAGRYWTRLTCPLSPSAATGVTKNFII